MKKISNQLDPFYRGVIAHYQAVDSILCHGITTHKKKLFLASPAFEILHQIFLKTFCQHLKSLYAMKAPHLAGLREQTLFRSLAFVYEGNRKVAKNFMVIKSSNHSLYGRGNSYQYYGSV